MLWARFMCLMVILNQLVLVWIGKETAASLRVLCIPSWFSLEYLLFCFNILLLQTPGKLPAYTNIIMTFDSYVWIMTAAALILLPLVLLFIAKVKSYILEMNGLNVGWYPASFGTNQGVCFFHWWIVIICMVYINQSLRGTHSEFLTLTRHLTL